MLYIEIKYLNQLSFRLERFKKKGDNAWNMRCPFCGDSKKNKLKTRFYIGENHGKLFYMCHNCQENGHISTLFEHLDPQLYKEYVFENLVANKDNTYSPTLANKNETFDDPDTAQKLEYSNWINCTELPIGHDCITYLESRNVPTEKYNLFYYTDNYRSLIDEMLPNNEKNLVEDKRLVIPIYDRNGNLLAVAGRAIEKTTDRLRYITIRLVENADKIIYGIDRLNFDEYINIVEGQFDSIFVDNCIASCDSNLILAADLLVKKYNVSKDNIRLIFDNQPRNKEIVKLIDKAIKLGYNIVIWPSNMNGKDINEFINNGETIDSIRDTMKNNTFKDILAVNEMVQWKKIQ